MQTNESKWFDLQFILGNKLNELQLKYSKQIQTLSYKDFKTFLYNKEKDTKFLDSFKIYLTGKNLSHSVYYEL